MKLPEFFKGYYNPHTQRHMISAEGVFCIIAALLLLGVLIGGIKDLLR